MAHEAESTAGHELTFDEELLLWLGDEPPGVRAADAERVTTSPPSSPGASTRLPTSGAL